MRLNKYIASSGLASRRKADELTAAGKVKVNGAVMTELGYDVQPGDVVTVNGKVIREAEKLCCYALNKPAGYVTTAKDDRGRPTVIDLLSDVDVRVYPVGRLDRNTTGVLLLTNDGDLAAKLTHPKFHKKKIYAVTLDRELDEVDEAIVRAGVILDEERVIPDALEFPKADRRHIGLEIHSGQNRVVRRIFEKARYKVVNLDRVSFAGLTKKNVGRGKWRFLTPKEVNMLHMGAF